MTGMKSGKGMNLALLLSYSLILLLCYSVTLLLSYSLTLLLSYSLTLLFSYFLILVFCYSVTFLLSHSLTFLLSHSFTLTDTHELFSGQLSEAAWFQSHISASGRLWEQSWTVCRSASCVCCAAPSLSFVSIPRLSTRTHVARWHGHVPER